MAKKQFPATMIRVHFGESDEWNGKPLYKAIVDKCLELGIAGATVYRGLEGFGASAKLHHARNWPFSRDAPIMLSVIDTEARISTLVPHLDSMVKEGIVAISKVEVIRYTSETTGAKM